MIGLYIHIPFCESKCGYCDFASYAGKEDKISAYIDAVIKEAEALKVYDLTADTVFIGGGTPSILPAGELTRLMDGIRESINIAENAEFSIEANPNSLDAATAKEYAAVGANRVSLGLQAAQPRLLKEIGRLHTPEDFLMAVENAKAAGIVNINGDMMYGLPTQTVLEAGETARFLLNAGVEHVSAYALKLEKGTPMYGASLPNDDTQADMLMEVVGILKEAGMRRYEISNFAKPGKECRHNLKYWRLEEYVGLGSAAHSFMVGERYANISDIDEYIERINKTGNAEVTRSRVDEQFEEIMLKTRTMDGIEIEKVNVPRAGQLVIQGLAELVCGRLKLTDEGMNIQNSVVLYLMD